MIIQDNLDISERGRFDVDDSQELRWNNGEIEFYNRDHDRLSYVSSAVSVINKAFWLSAQKILIVINNTNQVFIVDTEVNPKYTSQPFSSKITDIAIKNKNILILGSSDEIEIVDLVNGKKLWRFAVSVSHLNNMMITDNFRHAGFMTDSGYKIFSLLTGDEHITFKKKGFEPQEATFLRNNSWLTSDREGLVQWWDAEGNLITTLKHIKSIHNGIRFLDNGHLLCTNERDIVYEVDESGNIRAGIGQTTEWSPDDKQLSIFCSETSELVQSLREIEHAIESKSDLKKFPHIFSVIGLDKPEIEADGDNIQTGNSIKRGKVGNNWIWNFFYRPKIGNLYNQFYQVMRFVSGSETKLHELQESWETAKKNEDARHRRCARTSIIAVLFGLVGAALSFLKNGLVVEQHLTSWEFAAASALGFVISLLTWSGAAKAKRKSNEIDQAINILKISQQMVSEVRRKVKGYRKKLLEQVPKAGDGRPSDQQMSNHVTSLLEGKIREIALEECGLEEADVNSVDADGKPLKTYINEPAYLQFDDPAEVPKTLNIDNLVSFFLGPNNEPIFAVQFIQYFFLGSQKIDAFTCFYDFINDEMMKSEAHTFYYRDVTNISKRQLDLTDASRESRGLENAKVGVEMKLSVGSGAAILINIATDETYRAMNEGVERHVETEKRERIGNIEREIHNVKQNKELDENEKREELEDLNENLEAVKKEYERRIDEKFSSNTDTSQRIIQHVRGRLRELKET